VYKMFLLLLSFFDGLVVGDGGLCTGRLKEVFWNLGSWF